MLHDDSAIRQQNRAMPAPTSSNAAATINSNVSNEAVSKPANPPPPSKTDKPRPHVCGTCKRSFARLEHLKRHERSHTKEKPFECPECARCFARRDLLLRHQQKLHLTTTPSSRPRNRRESASSTATGTSTRVRKSAAANANTAASSMRPRANTISHVDGQALHNMVNANHLAVNKHGGASTHSRHPSLAGLPLHGDYPFGGMSNLLDPRAAGGMAKLDASSFERMECGLRTGPVLGAYGQDMDFESLLFAGQTINPNALHYNDSPQAMAVDAASPYHQGFPDMTSSQTLEENFDWMTGFESQLHFHSSNENAIDGSSPSAISTASQSGISDGVMLDGSNNPAATPGALWQQSMMAPPMMTPNPFALDMQAPGFPDLFGQGSMSPHAGSTRNPNDPYFSTPPPSMSSLSPSVMPGLNTQGLPHGRNFTPETPSSTNSNGQLALTLSTITEGTRQALLMALAQCAPFGTRKYSFPAVSSPLSPHFAGQANMMSEGSRALPSTTDLQRYVGAYIQYFHPHLPFLHIPTLSFHMAPPGGGRRPSGLFDGSGCLILSMAAIGALYEMEQAPSKDLFDSCKKLIQLYLEERRKEDVRKADMRKKGLSHAETHSTMHTPLWLVQAMLLNVVYGYNCGDKVAGEIASTHCAALVSLARAAELLEPQATANGMLHESHVIVDEPGLDGWNGIQQESPDDYAEWYAWKTNEERKRTLYGVFILSSLVVSAYNHAPALTNSEIRLLNLPCSEEFWTAESAASFKAMGGVRVAEQGQLTFQYALGELLSSSEKRPSPFSPLPYLSAASTSDLPPSDLRPSTFGCLVLINALHNYIWDTRQRHHNKIWTNEETEKMHHHIEPALKAWQAAWASHPHHSLERPNPHGLGPLSADSIPLLDLAYVRLFVNLGRSKERFWQRDFDGMADELARGTEMIQHAEHSPHSDMDSGGDSSGGSGSNFGDSPLHTSSHDFSGPSDMNHYSTNQQPASTSKRERHLRRAAFYAADSLSMSDKLGVTFADFTSRELPLQSAMCAFDCAQVLAEWVATVQERVGRYLGILGKDNIDVGQMPAIMLLEEEDCKLLDKIQEVLHSAEIKMNFELAGMNTMSTLSSQRLPVTDHSGYGAKILAVTAYMLDKAAAWPVTHIMAQALETQANHMRDRANMSVLQRE